MNEAPTAPLERSLRIAALLWVAATFAFSAYWSAQAPGGSWPNAIFGEIAWTEEDPGGFYVATAHEIGWGEAPLFVGHPATPLVLLLRAVQEGHHALAGDGTLSFTEHTVRHLAGVYFASKMGMTALHGLSFLALYAVGVVLLRDRRAALFAVAGYATSLPVAYFLSRISVEPLMIACIAGAFLAFWRSQDAEARGDAAARFAWVAVAAFAAVSGAMTKLSFVGPLPFLLALLVVVDARGPVPVRLAALGCFGVTGLLTLAFYSQFIDWALFRAVWGQLAQAPVSEGWSWASFAPRLGARHVFLPAEVPFALAGLAGLAMFLRSRPPALRRALGFGAYAGFGILLWAYRVLLEGHFLPFHYYFVAAMTLALGVGFGLAALLRRLGWAPVWGLVAVAVLHGVALAAVLDARRYDARIYAERGAVHDLVSQLGSDDRLGVARRGVPMGPTDPQRIGVHGFIFPFFFDPRRSELRDAFEALLVPLPRDAGDERVPVPAWDAEIAILRGAASAELRPAAERPMYPGRP